MEVQRKAVSIGIENPTLDDFRKCGRQAGEKYLASYEGKNGAEAFFAHRNAGWVDNAIANAINCMAATGATPEQVEAWAAGFAEPIAKHAAEQEARNRIEEAISGMFDPDALPGRGRDAT